MTEAEWISAVEPGTMLDYLDGKVGDRKLRLFACACCARVARLVTDPLCRDAVALAERFADGGVSADELRAVHASAQRSKPLFADANWAAAWSAAPPANHASWRAAMHAAQA